MKVWDSNPRANYWFAVRLPGGRLSPLSQPSDYKYNYSYSGTLFLIKYIIDIRQMSTTQFTLRIYTLYIYSISNTTVFILFKPLLKFSILDIPKKITIIALV